MIAKRKQRYDSLDILKGAAVFMVVWGHLIDNNNILFRYLNNLHLPIFFIISGYLLAESLSKYSCSHVLKKRFLHLFVPFLSWSTVALILKVLIKIKSNCLSLKAIYNIFLDVYIFANSAWFLWVLFLGSCLIIFYEKINKRKYLFWIFILSIYIFVPNIILKLGKLKIMFPILFLGFWLHKKSGERWLNSILFRTGGIIFSIYFLIASYFIYDKEMYIAFTEFKISFLSKDAIWYLYYWSIQLSGIFFSIYILFPLIKSFHLEKGMKILGIYSLDIYMQHLFFVNYIVKISIYNMFLKQIITILCAIFITLLCTIMSKYILHKIAFYRFFMLGQKCTTNSKII